MSSWPGSSRPFLLSPDLSRSETAMHAPLPPVSRLAIAGDGSVEGYASLFGEVDQARDMMMPGAFAHTLASRGIRKVPMLFQHDPAEPVGIWLELVEDFRGLRARGRLIPDVRRGRELLALLEQGAIDGLSIGYRTVRARIDPRTRIRKLYQVDLWEISIVTFPLLDGARIRRVKTADAPSRLRARTGSGWAWRSPDDAADAPASSGRRCAGALTAIANAARTIA